MPSKQEIAKDRQGYDPKPEPSVCSKCKHYTFEMKLPSWMEQKNTLAAQNIAMRGLSVELLPYGKDQEVETNMRCGIGHFAVKKSATCRLFERKES